MALTKATFYGQPEDAEDAEDAPEEAVAAEEDAMSWVYIRSEPRLWTVGFYGPDGTWHTDSDYDDSEEAAKRTSWLNGLARDR